MRLTSRRELKSKCVNAPLRPARSTSSGCSRSIFHSPCSRRRRCGPSSSIPIPACKQTGFLTLLAGAPLTAHGLEVSNKEHMHSLLQPATFRQHISEAAVSLPEQGSGQSRQCTHSAGAAGGRHRGLQRGHQAVSLGCRPRAQPVSVPDWTHEAGFPPRNALCLHSMPAAMWQGRL